MNIFYKSLIPSFKILTDRMSTDQDKTYSKILRSCFYSTNQDEKYCKTFIPDKSSMLNLPTLHIPKEETRPCVTVTKEWH
jgi:hypothetical protein